MRGSGFGWISRWRSLYLVCPIHDGFTSFLGSILLRFGSGRRVVSLVEKGPGALAMLEKMLVGTQQKILVFAGHGSRDGLLKRAAEREEADAFYDEEVLRRARIVAFFGYCCWSCGRFGEEIARAGGIAIGYSEEIPFVFRGDGETIEDVFGEPLELMAKHLAERRGLDKDAYEMLVERYRELIVRLRGGDESERRRRRACRMALRIHEDLLVIRGGGSNV